MTPAVERLKVRDVEESFWNTLWALPIPSKIRTFLWRPSRNILPATDSLRAQHMPVVDGCARCDSRGEIAIHAIVQCPTIREIWSSCPFTFPQDRVNVISFQQFLQRCFVSESRDQLG